MTENYRSHFFLAVFMLFILALLPLMSFATTFSETGTCYEVIVAEKVYVSEGIYAKKFQFGKAVVNVGERDFVLDPNTATDLPASDITYRSFSFNGATFSLLQRGDFLEFYRERSQPKSNRVAHAPLNISDSTMFKIRPNEITKIIRISNPIGSPSNPLNSVPREESLVITTSTQKAFRVRSNAGQLEIEELAYLDDFNYISTSTDSTTGARLISVDDRQYSAAREISPGRHSSANRPVNAEISSFDIPNNQRALAVLNSTYKGEAYTYLLTRDSILIIDKNGEFVKDENKYSGALGVDDFDMGATAIVEAPGDQVALINKNGTLFLAKKSQLHHSVYKAFNLTQRKQIGVVDYRPEDVLSLSQDETGTYMTYVVRGDDGSAQITRKRIRL